MSKSALGVVLALSFILMEALQTVYFGGLFQRMSSFLFSVLVFGGITVVSLGWTWLNAPESFRLAFGRPWALLGINICALMTFSCFLISVQLIEPAISYTISAGTMPIAAYALYRFGVSEAEALRNWIEALGNALLLIAIAYLSYVTIFGDSGFVRGGPEVAALGVVLAMLDGVFFTLLLVFSKRMDLAGVGSFSVLGLRLPLYVVSAGALAGLGVDAKGALSGFELLGFVTIGFLLTLPPLYLLQRSVTMISTLTISSLTATGPFLIFVLQIFEGRVAYATQTLIGVSLYALASVLTAFGAVYAVTR